MSRTQPSGAGLPEELEARLSALISGELGLDSPEARLVIEEVRRVGGEVYLTPVQLRELRGLHDALEFNAVVDEALQTQEAPGAESIERILQEAANRGLPEPAVGTSDGGWTQDAPDHRAPGASTHDRWAAGRSPLAWLAGGLLVAAAALLLVLRWSPDHGTEGDDLTSKTLGPDATETPGWAIEGGTLQIPHDFKAGQVVDVVMERWTDGGSWEPLFERSSQSEKMELKEDEQKALDAAGRVRLRAWLISADGSRSSLYSGSVTRR